MTIGCWLLHGGGRRSRSFWFIWLRSELRRMIDRWLLAVALRKQAFSQLRLASVARAPGRTRLVKFLYVGVGFSLFGWRPAAGCHIFGAAFVHNCSWAGVGTPGVAVGSQWAPGGKNRRQTGQTEADSQTETQWPKKDNGFTERSVEQNSARANKQTQ